MPEKIQVSCEGCNSRLAVPETAAGKKLRCPKCQTIIEVPTLSVPVQEPPTQKPQAQRSVTQRPQSQRSQPQRPQRKRGEPEDYDSKNDSDADVDWIETGASDYHDPYGSAPSYAANSVSGMPGRSAHRSATSASSGSASNQKAVTSGVLMIVGSIVWFFGALIFLDRLFYYPPILLVIGIVTVIKGFRGES